MHLVLIVENNLIRRHVYSTMPVFRLMGIAQKTNNSSLRRRYAVKNARQRFITALHPELMQIYFRQFSVKGPLCGWNKFKLRSANSRLVDIRIRIILNGICRHRLASPGSKSITTYNRPQLVVCRHELTYLAPSAWIKKRLITLKCDNRHLVCSYSDTIISVRFAN